MTTHSTDNIARCFSKNVYSKNPSACPAVLALQSRGHDIRNIKSCCCNPKSFALYEQINEKDEPSHKSMYSHTAIVAYPKKGVTGTFIAEAIVHYDPSDIEKFPDL